MIEAGHEAAIISSGGPAGVFAFVSVLYSFM